jgi:hypothetical protein
MKHGYGRTARPLLAPKAVILGLATFQFGCALKDFAQPRADYYGSDEELFLFLSFTLLSASACLAVNRAWGGVLAASLCGPVPLAHAFGFWLTAQRAGVPMFSMKHLELVIHGIADFPAALWLLTALSLTILSVATAATLRSPSKPEPISRA